MHAEPLLIFFPPDHDRRIKVIQNVITGKSRTVATLFWGMQYQLLGYYKVFDQVPKEFSQSALSTCLKAGFLTSVNKYQYRLSSSSQNDFEELEQRYRLNLNFHDNLDFDIDRFTQRFYLANQIISEYSYHQNHYYPLQINHSDQMAVKYWFHYHKSTQLIKDWTNLLTSFLNSLSTNDLAWQFASSLVGNEQVGATFDQQADWLDLPSPIIKLRQRLLMNQLLNKILSIDSPILHQLLLGVRTSFVSQSALLTISDWKSGLTLSQIANKRHLKISTVREHIEEAAIFISWHRVPFEKLITSKHRNLFEQHLTGNLENWDFNALKNYDKNLDYFEFRLYQILRSREHGRIF